MAAKNNGNGQGSGVDELKETYAKIMAVYDDFELELDRIKNKKNRLLNEIEKRLNDKKIQAALDKVK